ncbi:MAG: hypothetical protein AAB881_00270 [Patescibacteria group bacterium]
MWIELWSRDNRIYFQIYNPDGEKKAEVGLSIDYEQAERIANEAVRKPTAEEAAEYILRAYMVLPGPNEVAAEYRAEAFWAER